VDLDRSISLRPDEDARLTTWFGAGTYHPIADLNFHGTFVSTIVASNAINFAGVTSRTKLFGVKVCNVFGSCSSAAVLSGIIYAVDHGADVINMSLGGSFSKRANPGFVQIIKSVFNYANKRGTVIVVSAGNAATNMDADPDLYFAYCDSPHVLCVSATGPTGFAGGQFVNPDAFAPYSNFGNAISVAAPGGRSTSTSLTRIWGPCSETALAVHQDPPPSPGAPPPPPVIDGPACIPPPPPFLWVVSATGTSFSAPHVAGVVAAIFAAGGHDKASKIRRTLERTSDDLLPAGKDRFFGRGRVNMSRALTGMEDGQFTSARN
jgi:subtilisin family serine protease